MHVAIIFLFTSSLIIAVVMTFGEDMIDTYSILTNRWDTLNGEWEEQSNTLVSGPDGGAESITATSTVRIPLTNKGRVAFEEFSKWDVVLELQQDPNLEVTYPTYTTSSSPSVNEWTVEGIYLDEAATIDENRGPDIFNPGETLMMLVNPTSTMAGRFYNRATISTPNGFTVAVHFYVPPREFYVVDSAGAKVYRYEETSTLLGSSDLDPLNADAAGLAKNGSDFWTTDIQDDEAYKYTSVFTTGTTWAFDTANLRAEGITTEGTNIWTAEFQTNEVFMYDMIGTYVSKFALTSANRDARGIATDGTYLWVVDDKDSTVYKYTVAGALDSSFPLDSGNASAPGITTDGTNIWVVDSGGPSVYKYTLGGTFKTSFDLDAANTDPQGIVISSR